MAGSYGTAQTAKSISLRLWCDRKRRPHRFEGMARECEARDVSSLGALCARLGRLLPVHLIKPFAAVYLLGLSSCSSGHDEEKLAASDGMQGGAYLFHAENTLQDEWIHARLRGETDYRLAVFEGHVAIRARGRGSASGLIRDIDLDPRICSEIEWAWAVTKLQQHVDLHDRSGDDVAASLFLLFGDPGSFLAPQPVPTLRYVWTSEAAAEGDVIANPYMAQSVKSIVVETGTQTSPSWIVERRNILEDFETAFGSPPEASVQAIALFTDNDQSLEPVEAYYGWARPHCLSELLHSPSAEE